MTASSGRWASLEKPRLSPSSSLEMTQLAEASEPAAGMVRTQATGSLRATSSSAFFAKRSHTSPSIETPAAMALAVSMTEPPPTASTTSASSARAAATPSRTRPTSGFGRTPPSCAWRTPARSSEVSTRSSVPVRTTEPLP